MTLILFLIKILGTFVHVVHCSGEKNRSACLRKPASIKKFARRRLRLSVYRLYRKHNNCISTCTPHPHPPPPSFNQAFLLLEEKTSLDGPAKRRSVDESSISKQAPLAGNVHIQLEDFTAAWGSKVGARRYR